MVLFSIGVRAGGSGALAKLGKSRAAILKVGQKSGRGLKS